MNSIIITGRLARDPELRTTNSGTEVAGFTVAVDRVMKGQNGEKLTDFIDCTAWGKTGVFVNTYFHKGDGITVNGRMESHKWTDKDGNNRTSWGITCDKVEFPFSNRGGNQSTAVSAAPAYDAPQSSGFQDVGEETGELPF